MSEEAFCVQMVGQLGRVLELIGWFQAEIVVAATTSFIPDLRKTRRWGPRMTRSGRDSRRTGFGAGGGPTQEAKLDPENRRLSELDKTSR